MKAFADLKSRQMSTAVAAAPLPNRNFDLPQSFGKPSRGRLYAVPPQSAKTITTGMLTTEEFIQVMLATVRESSRHRYWPTEVLVRFAAADVMR